MTKEKEEAIRILTTKRAQSSTDWKMAEVYTMAIKALEQEPKTGHWIPVYGKNGKTIMSYKCSECQFHPKRAIITDFCGGCGADMRKEN